MAIVKGPLFSIEARGAIAEAMVHFPWKGRAVVRKWLKPANPRFVDQKLIRQKMAILGKNVKVIEQPSDVLANGSAMYTMIKAVTPANSIWNATFAKLGMDLIKDDTQYIIYKSDYSNATSKGAWDSCAAALGIETLTGVAYASSIPAGMQLFVGGLVAYDNDFCDTTTSYSTYPTNWLTATISLFATDYTKAY